MEEIRENGGYLRVDLRSRGKGPFPIEQYATLIRGKFLLPKNIEKVIK